jgi:lipoprotein NlpD
MRDNTREPLGLEPDLTEPSPARTPGRGAESWFALVACVALIAGCANHAQAPVQERSPLGARPATAAPVAQTVPPPAAPVREVPTYTVKKGDTLYLIALDHGHDYKDIAAWNGVENPDRIRVGQVLRLGPPGETEVLAPVGTAQVNPVQPRQSVEARPLGATGSAPAGVAAAPAVTAAGAPPNTKTTPKTGKEAYAGQVASATPAANVAAPAAPTAPVTTGGDDDKVDWGWPAQGKMLGTFSEATNKGVDIAGKVGDPVTASASGKVVYSGTGLRGYGKLIIIKHNASYLSAYAHNSQILVKEGQLVTKGQKIAEVGNTDAEQPMLHFEIRKQGKPVDPLKYLPAQG